LVEAREVTARLEDQTVSKSQAALLGRKGVAAHLELVKQALLQAVLQSVVPAGNSGEDEICGVLLASATSLALEKFLEADIKNAVQVLCGASGCLDVHKRAGIDWLVPRRLTVPDEFAGGEVARFLIDHISAIKLQADASGLRFSGLFGDRGGGGDSDFATTVSSEARACEFAKFFRPDHVAEGSLTAIQLLDPQLITADEINNARRVAREDLDPGMDQEIINRVRNVNNFGLFLACMLLLERKRFE
jgi:hypothetical protein